MNPPASKTLPSSSMKGIVMDYLAGFVLRDTIVPETEFPDTDLYESVDFMPESEAGAFDLCEVPWLLPLAGSESTLPASEAAPWLLLETEAARLPLAGSESTLPEYEAAPWLLPETEAAPLPLSESPEPLSESPEYDSDGFHLSEQIRREREKAKRIADLRESFRRDREEAKRTSEVRESFRRDREEAKRLR